MDKHPVLLAVLAHPDDETFGMGGTLALYASRGCDVYLVCATRGEVGTMDEDCLDGFDSPGDRRWSELKCAASILGLADVIYLGYRDSGMPGSPDNKHPQALAAAPLEEVTGRVVKVIRDLRIGRTFFTNNSSKSTNEYLNRLQRLGIEVQPSEVYSSTLCTLDYLREERPTPPRSRQPYACYNLLYRVQRATSIHRRRLSFQGKSRTVMKPNNATDSFGLRRALLRMTTRAALGLPPRTHSRRIPSLRANARRRPACGRLRGMWNDWINEAGNSQTVDQIANETGPPNHCARRDR